MHTHAQTYKNIAAPARQDAHLRNTRQHAVNMPCSTNAAPPCHALLQWVLHSAHAAAAGGAAATRPGSRPGACSRMGRCPGGTCWQRGGQENHVGKKQSGHGIAGPSSETASASTSLRQHSPGCVSGQHLCCAKPLLQKVQVHAAIRGYPVSRRRPALGGSLLRRPPQQELETQTGQGMTCQLTSMLMPKLPTSIKTGMLGSINSKQKRW